MNIDVASYRNQCFEEIDEILARVETNLLGVGAERVEVERVHELFRDVHTIKGSCGVVGLTAISSFAHELETILDRLRLGELTFTGELSDLLFFALDGLRSLSVTERRGEPPMEDVGRTFQAMKSFLNPEPSDQPEKETAPPETEPSTAVQTQPSETEPLPEASAEVEYGVAFVPSGRILSEGVEPLHLIDALASLGRVERVALFTRQLPPIDAIKPGEGYFFWYHTLRSSRPGEDIQSVFAALAPEHHVSVEPIRPGAASPKDFHGRDAALAARLLEAGSVSEAALAAALQCQRQCRVPLEKLALRDGKIDAGQYDAIREQIAQGTPFTVCALHVAELASSAVESLVDGQSRLRPALSECLSGLSLIDPSVLAEAEQALSEVADEAPAPEPEPEPEPELRRELKPEPRPAPEPSVPVAHRDAADDPPTLSPVNADAMPPSELLIENLGMLPEFLTEVQDHLNTADQLLLSLEREPTRRDLLDALYRAFHTVKGAAGFFGLEDMKSVAHEAESLLGDARDEKITLTGRNADFTFGSLDGLNRQLEILRAWLGHRGNLPRDAKALQLVKELRCFRAGKLPEPTPVLAPKPVAPPAPSPEPAGFEVFDEPLDAPPVPVPAVETKEKPDHPAAPAAPVTPAAPATPAAPGGTGEHETIRVDCERLDKLINMIGELVISSSMVEQEVAGSGPSATISPALSQMNKIVRDLQELSLGLRMVPIAGTFRKMERIVRDIARKLGKKVQFVCEGEETELDKTVVDQIGDPLMHMVRNSVDHGIEMPEVREASGKPEQGTVRLRAFHQGGNIFIELTDDGKGLDRKAIYHKAVERGLIADGATLTDAEICSFIFHPGFSTAKQVTDLSGRGVGMDVVRRNVEALQGSVTIRSEQGRGSTMAIRLPLTLAILDGLCVSLNQEVFVLPLLSVIESFQPGASEVKKIAGQTEVILVRGEVVPLLRLYRIFQTPARCIDPTQGLVVIVEEQGKKCALLVDELLGQSQVVIKNLEKNFAKIDGISGATIMGDGRVGLILDIFGLTRMAGRSVTGLTEQDSYPPIPLSLQGVDV
jgi:two-component system, chemotaxis family, sensor kinase CheA